MPPFAELHHTNVPGILPDPLAPLPGIQAPPTAMQTDTHNYGKTMPRNPPNFSFWGGGDGKLLKC